MNASTSAGRTCCGLATIVAQSLFHDHVPAQGRPADRLDQPPARQARLGRHTSTPGRRRPGLGTSHSMAAFADAVAAESDRPA
jgi:hypothetical protein